MYVWVHVRILRMRQQLLKPAMEVLNFEFVKYINGMDTGAWMASR